MSKPPKKNFNYVKQELRFFLIIFFQTNYLTMKKFIFYNLLFKLNSITRTRKYKVW